jgi:hypothetical protein
MRGQLKTGWILLIILSVLVVAPQALGGPPPPSFGLPAAPWTPAATTLGATALYQESDARLAYSAAWKSVSNSKCYGGRMRTRNAAGSVTAKFTGTAVSVFSTKGRAYGIMKVTLDGVSSKANLYAASSRFKAKVFSRTGLANTSHTLTLAWTGRKSAAATAKTVNLDALSITGTLTGGDPGTLPGTQYQEGDTHLRFLGAWTLASGASFAGGKQATVNGPGQAYMQFSGTEAYVLATKGPSYGKMLVYLDAAPPVTVDLYSAQARYKQPVFRKGGLTNTAHQVVAAWAGSKNASSSAMTVNVDAFGAVGSLLQVPDMTGGLVGKWGFVEVDWAELYTFNANGTYTRVITTNLDQGNDGTFVHQGIWAAYWLAAQNSWVLALRYRSEKFTPEGGPDGSWEALGDVDYLYYIDGTTLWIKEYSSSYTGYNKQ